MLLSAVWDKKNRLTKEKEGELALELKLLEQSLREPHEDTEEKAKRKVRAGGVGGEVVGHCLI